MSNCLQFQTTCHAFLQPLETRRSSFQVSVIFDTNTLVHLSYSSFYEPSYLLHLVPFPLPLMGTKTPPSPVGNVNA